MEGNMFEKVEEEKEMGVMVHKAINGSRQVAEAVKKANCALTQIRRTISNTATDSHTPAYKHIADKMTEYCAFECKK